ncbi:MAG: hypothetical protein Q7R47_02910 [Candidatus Diapherotrites archaeon]|nr:hypothetical protein [Candidatus Diapherotrites archaeon]
MVHPFFEALHSPLQYPKNPFAKKNIKFLSALWGSEVQRVKKNPNEALIFLKPPMSRSREGSPAEMTFRGFLSFAQKELGNRMVVVPTELSEKRTWALHVAPSVKNKTVKIVNFNINIDAARERLLAKFKEQGLVLGPRLGRPRAFGEWFEQCVARQSDALSRILRVPVKRLPHLSVSDRVIPRNEKGRLGSFEQDLRAQAARLRRRQSKRAHRKKQVPVRRGR